MKSGSPESSESRVVQKNRLRAIIFLILAGVAGLAGLWMVTQYINSIKKAIPRVSADIQMVVVASMDIPIATRLDAKHLTVSPWPKQGVPEGSYSKAADLVGHTVRQSIVKGEPFLDRKVIDGKQGQGMAALLDIGIRAMAVEVDSVVGVAGFVQPGDYVDVITIMNLDEEAQKDRNSEANTIAKIILQNIKVLAVGEHLATEGREAVKVKVVTLAVTPGQSERLALGSRHGRILLTIRPRIDQEIEATAGITPLKLLTPDQGARIGVVKEREQEPVIARRSVDRRRPSKKEDVVVAPAAPAIPTVEIIRGSRVEERKMRSYDVPTR